MADSKALNPTQFTDRYSQLGLLDPTFASFRLLTESKRAAEASLDHHKIHTLDRLVSDQCKILRGSNQEQELETLKRETSSLPIQRALEDYRRHQLKASTHLNEAISTIQDTGTGKDITLASSDVRVAATHYSMQANTAVWESAFTNISCKQLIFNNAYTHLISDVDQRTVKHAWLRAERHNAVISQTSSVYVEQQAENVYGSLRDTVGERVLLCDTYVVQVGENFSSGTGLLPRVQPLSALSSLGTPTQLQDFTKSIGGLGKLENYISQVGAVPNFLEVVEQAGGLSALTSLTEQVGGLDALNEKLNLLPDHSLKSLEDYTKTFSNPQEAVDFLRADPTTASLLEGVQIEPDTFSSTLQKMSLLNQLDQNRYRKPESQSGLPYGSYVVRAEKEIVFETPGTVDFRGVKTISLDPKESLNLKSRQVSLSSMGKLEIRSNAETAISSISTVRIDGSTVMINCLSPRPVKPSIPKPLTKPVEKKPKSELLRPLPRTKLEATRAAAGIEMGGQKFILPPQGTAGPLRGVAPSEHSVHRGLGTDNTNPAGVESRYSTKDRGF